MPKYLLLKHDRGGPEPHRPVPPMDQWALEDVEAHMAFLKHVSELLEENGEYADAQALTPARTWVGYGGPDAAPVTTDGPLPRPAISWRAGTRSTSSRTSSRSSSRPTSPRARPGRGAAVRVDQSRGGHVRGALGRLTRRDRRADATRGEDSADWLGSITPLK
jgi:hypothetical protein